MTGQACGYFQAWGCRGVQGDASGEVVDEADEGGEGALGDQLQQVRWFEPGVQSASQHRLGDGAAVEHKGSGEGVDGRLEVVEGFVPAAHRLGCPEAGETTYDISPYRFEIQRRHVFHMELTQPTPERWTSQELHDGEQAPTNFECFWIPLEAAHVLQSGQGALLGALYT